MRESIAARVGRIVSGSFHAVVDAVENAAPETVMEQAIREIDGAIDDVRTELGQTAAGKHLASRRLTDANTRHEDLAGKIELAVEQGRDDLAEAAIAQQLDLEAQIPVLELTIKESGEREKELEGFIAALQAKKREMKQDLSEYRKANAQAAAATAAGGTDGQAGAKSNVHTRVERAESAFDRVLEKQTGVAGVRGDLKQSSQLAELEDMSRKNRIQERLAAAKAQLKKD